MSAAAVGTWDRSDVRGRCPHAETAVRERVFDAEVEAEWVARLRIEDVFHHDPVRLVHNGSPGSPADEAVDRVVALRLVQRQLIAASVELVAAILQPVRPGDQHLPPRRGAHLLGPVAVDKFPAANGICAQSPANLDDHGALMLGRDFELLAGWRNHGALRARFSAPAGVRRRWAVAPTTMC